MRYVQKIGRFLKKRPKLSIVLGLVVGFSLAYILFIQKAMNRANVEFFMGTPLPKEATHIKSIDPYWYVPMPDHWMYIRFELPSENLPDFLDDFCFGDDLRSDYPLPNSWDGIFLDWYDPESVNIYVGERCSVGGIIYEIIIDQENSDNFIIYMSVSHM